MTVRPITQAEYADAARVWKVCFPEDTDAFIEYYFKRRTRPQYILAAFSHGAMIGTLHILPQYIGLFGELKRIGFVAGVATLPEHRHRGVCTAMMQSAFSAMRAEGCCATVLQPFDVPFYEQYGYKTFVRRREYRYAPGELTPGGAALHTPELRELGELYARFAARYNGMALRDEATLAALYAECSGGAQFAAAGNAYAMYYEEASALNVMELCGDASDMPALLGTLNQASSLTVRVPLDVTLPGTARELPFNMLCPLDQKELMRGLPCKYDTLLAGDARINYSFESY